MSPGLINLPERIENVFKIVSLYKIASLHEEEGEEEIVVKEETFSGMFKMGKYEIWAKHLPSIIHINDHIIDFPDGFQLHHLLHPDSLLDLWEGLPEKVSHRIRFDDLSFQFDKRQAEIFKTFLLEKKRLFDNVAYSDAIRHLIPIDSATPFRRKPPPDSGRFRHPLSGAL